MHTEEWPKGNHCTNVETKGCLGPQLQRGEVGYKSLFHVWGSNHSSWCFQQYNQQVATTLIF